MNFLELNNLTVVRRTLGELPNIPYQKIKDAILGKKYLLDISFVNTATSTELHIEHKKKPGPANTLAFPYSESEGEIIMHLETIRRQAALYERSYRQHLLFLSIHSMLHLLGYTHGDEMETQEEKFYTRFLKEI